MSRAFGRRYRTQFGISIAEWRLVVLSLTPQRALVARLLPVAMRFQAEMKARLGARAEALDAALSVLLAPRPPADRPDG